jgi:RpiR family carbohydrate utilization transcriptional regulator
MPYLNPALQRIAEYVLEYPEQCKTMTIKQLAAACSVADSTVSRFVKAIDLKSYQDLKIAIAEALSSNDRSDVRAEEKHIYEGISPTDSIATIIEKVVYQDVQTLTAVKQRLNVDELNKAAEVIDKANIIVFCGMGSSGVAAEEAVMRFTRAGKKCLLFRDQGLQLMTMAILGRQDVVIGISNSGRTKLVVESVRLAQSKGAQTIVITSFEDSPLAKHADISLFTPTKSPPPGLNLYGEATTSVSAQILVIDVLYLSFAARHFDQTLKFLEETYTAAIRHTRGM